MASCLAHDTMLFLAHVVTFPMTSLALLPTYSGFVLNPTGSRSTRPRPSTIESSSISMCSRANLRATCSYNTLSHFCMALFSWPSLGLRPSTPIFTSMWSPATTRAQTHTKRSAARPRALNPTAVVAASTPQKPLRSRRGRMLSVSK